MRRNQQVHVFSTSFALRILNYHARSAGTTDAASLTPFTIYDSPEQGIKFIIIARKKNIFFSNHQGITLLLHSLVNSLLGIDVISKWIKIDSIFFFLSIIFPRRFSNRSKEKGEEFRILSGVFRPGWERIVPRFEAFRAIEYPRSAPGLIDRLNSRSRERGYYKWVLEPTCRVDGYQDADRRPSFSFNDPPLWNTKNFHGDVSSRVSPTKSVPIK